MRILLVNAINIGNLLEIRYPPLGLGYLASSLRQHFPDMEFKIIDSDFEHWLDTFKPDVVGISSVTQNYNIAKMYAKLAKQRGLKVLIGGVHVSTLPESMSSDMDIAVIGEGERTIVELFKNNFKNLDRIKGIAYRKDGKLIQTDRRPLITNLDDIPLPARDLLTIESLTYMFTSRGCPYRCVFCSSSRFWNTVRFHSAKHVVDEIKMLINDYGVKRIELFDDLFIADKSRLRQIVRLIKEENIHVKFGCSARANLLDEETAQLLSQMGVEKIVLGLESGNERILKFLKGGNVTVEDNYRALRIANKYGITVNAGFVIGSPDETEQEILDTLKLAKTPGLNHYETYVITPLPGTPIWDVAKKKGMVSDDMDWDKLNVMFASNYNDAVIISETLSRQKLFELFKKFRRHQLYLKIRNGTLHPVRNESPKILLKMIKSKFRGNITSPNMTS